MRLIAAYAPSQVTRFYRERVGALSFFVTDVIAVLPLDVLYLLAVYNGCCQQTNWIRIFWVFRLLRLFQVRRISSQPFDKYFDRADTISISFRTRRLLKLLGISILAIHLMACAWFTAADLLSQSVALLPEDSCPKALAGNRLSWFVHKHGRAIYLSAGELYLISCYFVITSVSTVGLGDLTATNALEMVLDMLFIFAGDAIFGTIIGAVSSNVFATYELSSKQLDNINVVNIYLQEKGISQRLRARITSYQNRLIETEDAQALLDLLPVYLKREVTYAMYGSMLNEVTFFVGCNHSFLRSLSVYLRPLFVLRGETIIHSGDVSNEMYFLLQGTISVAKAKRIDEFTNSAGVQTSGSMRSDSTELNQESAANAAPALASIQPNMNFAGYIQTLAKASRVESKLDKQKDEPKQLTTHLFTLTASTLDHFRIIFGEVSILTSQVCCISSLHILCQT